MIEIFTKKLPGHRYRSVARQLFALRSKKSVQISGEKTAHISLEI